MLAFQQTMASCDGNFTTARTDAQHTIYPSQMNQQSRPFHLPSPSLNPIPFTRQPECTADTLILPLMPASPSYINNYASRPVNPLSDRARIQFLRANYDADPIMLPSKFREEAHMPHITDLPMNLAAPGSIPYDPTLLTKQTMGNCIAVPKKNPMAVLDQVGVRKRPRTKKSCMESFMPATQPKCGINVSALTAGSNPMAPRQVGVAKFNYRSTAPVPKRINSTPVKDDSDVVTSYDPVSASACASLAARDHIPPLISSVHPTKINESLLMNQIGDALASTSARLPRPRPPNPATEQSAVVDMSQLDKERLNSSYFRYALARNDVTNYPHLFQREPIGNSVTEVNNSLFVKPMLKQGIVFNTNEYLVPELPESGPRPYSVLDPHVSLNPILSADGPLARPASSGCTAASSYVPELFNQATMTEVTSVRTEGEQPRQSIQPPATFSMNLTMRDSADQSMRNRGPVSLPMSSTNGFRDQTTEMYTSAPPSAPITSLQERSSLSKSLTFSPPTATLNARFVASTAGYSMNDSTVVRAPCPPGPENRCKPDTTPTMPNYSSDIRNLSGMGIAAGTASRPNYFLDDRITRQLESREESDRVLTNSVIRKMSSALDKSQLVLAVHPSRASTVRARNNNHFDRSEGSKVLLRSVYGCV